MTSSFRWEAVDGQGRMKQGVLEADTPRAVRDQLRAGGLTPTAVDAAAGRARRSPARAFPRRCSR